MTIKEYCENIGICENCLLFDICKGKEKPKDYTYSGDVWATHQLLKLLKILSEE